eukprot:gene2627-3824_t
MFTKFFKPSKHLLNKLIENENVVQNLILKCEHSISKSNYEDGIKYSNRILKLFNEKDIMSNEIIRGYSLRGTCLMEKGDFKNAIKDFNKITKYIPNDLYHLELKGDCLIKLNEFEEGMKLYDQIIYVNNDLNIIYKRGKLYFHLQNFEKALDDFEFILSKNNDYYFDSLIGCAECCIQLNKLKESKEYYKRILELDSNNLIGNEGISLIYSLEEDFENALNHINICIENSDESLELICKRSYIQLNLNNFKESIKDSNKIINNFKNEMNNDLSLAYFVRANSLKEIEKYKEALNDLDIYLKYNPIERKRMDQYFVVKLLGSGYEGQVTNEQVAIKRIELDTIEKANETINEAWRLTKLHHKNINLLNFDPKKRPTTFEILKENRILIKKHFQIEKIKIISGELKELNNLNDKLLIYLFNFLQVSDLYNVMRELGIMTKKNLKIFNIEKEEEWKKYKIKYYDFQGRVMIIRKKQTLENFEEAAINDENKLIGIAQIMLFYIEEGIKYGRVFVTTKYDSYNKSQTISVAIWNTPYNNKLITSWRRLKKIYLLII